MTARASPRWKPRVRGLDDTTASAFNAGDKLELRVTKILMDDIQEDAADEAMAMAIALG